MLKKLTLITISTFAITSNSSASEFMDASWAKQMCNAWNKNATLKTGLASWAKNDAHRGYKLIQVYRTHCGVKSKIQLNIIVNQEVNLMVKR